MPASDLKSDVQANIAELVALASSTRAPSDPEGQPEPVIVTPGEKALLNHLQHTLWPFMDGLVDQLKVHEDALEEAGDIISEIEDAMDELTEQRGSVLMPKEAGVFATLILLSRELAQTLGAGGVPAPDKILALRIAADAAEKVITDCTIDVNIDDDGDDGDDDGDDEDDDDDDEGDD